MATWKKGQITDDNSVVREAQFPVIISASRSTDIPAFYVDWFFTRLQKGYSAWTNPFNGVKSYVSYNDVRFIVFWSKNPRPLLEHLHILDEHNIKCYIQYTLNDYEREGLEKVPLLEYRIETFKMLSERLGKDAVIWRFDPLLLTDKISIDDLLGKIQNIGDQLKEYTKKLVFSFADIESYKKVKNNLIHNGIHYREWENEQMETFAEKLSNMNIERGWKFRLATCGEKIDINKYGIAHNRCIDGDLITLLAWEDKQLMDYMKVKIEDVPSPNLFAQQELPEGAISLPHNHYFISNHKKDSGQRQFCECMASKDIGEYNTCVHLCEYCYANTSKNAAALNYNCHKINPNADTITGK